MSLVFILCVALAAEPSASTSDQGVPWIQQRNLVYDHAHGVALVMDVFLPKGPRNGLGIVDVCSGSYFSDRDRIDKHRRTGIFDLFCGKGYVVFAVRPGSFTKFCIPEMAQNVRRAIAWVKLYHRRYGVDPDKLGLTGSSAGGHLCLLAAVAPNPPLLDSVDPLDWMGSSVEAVGVLFPPTDYLTMGGRRELSKDTIDTMPELMRGLLAGPHHHRLAGEAFYHHVVGCSLARCVSDATPPVLLIHGDKDIVVPIQQSRAMLAALQAARTLAELRVLPGLGHGYEVMKLAVPGLVEWFDKRLIGR